MFVFFIAELNLKAFQEISKNSKGTKILDQAKLMKVSEEKIKINKITQEKEKSHEIVKKKKQKEKRTFYELSDEFFSEKTSEVSFNPFIIILV